MAAAVLFLLIAVHIYTLALLFDAVIEKYLTRIRFFRDLVNTLTLNNVTITFNNMTLDCGSLKLP